MKREEKEAKIIEKIKELPDENIEALYTLVFAMAFKDMKGLKEYSSFLGEPESEEGKHLREEFLNYQKRHPRD